MISFAARRRRTSPALASRSVIAGVMTLVLSACDGPTEAARVATLSIDPSPLSLASGGSARLSVVARDAAGRELADVAVRWTSSDTAVAAVDASGRVVAAIMRGGSPGLARIRASADSVSAEVPVTVAIVPVAEVRLAANVLTLARGDTLRIGVAVLDATGAALTGRNVLWSSSANTTVAVSADGLLLAITEGTAVIRARVDAVGDSTIVTVPPAALPTATR